MENDSTVCTIRSLDRQKLLCPEMTVNSDNLQQDLPHQFKQLRLTQEHSEQLRFTEEQTSPLHQDTTTTTATSNQLAHDITINQLACTTSAMHLDEIKIEIISEDELILDISIPHSKE